MGKFSIITGCKQESVLRSIRCMTGIILPLLLILSPALLAQQVRVGTISSSINNWPLWVDEAKGMFADEGLDVQVTVTGES